jgi:hypothetical protein
VTENHDALIVLQSQYADLCRRIDELREDVQSGFARMDACNEKFDERLRTVEANDITHKEQLSTWRKWILGMTGLSAVVAGLVSFAKEIVGLLR